MTSLVRVLRTGTATIECVYALNKRTDPFNTLEEKEQHMTTTMKAIRMHDYGAGNVLRYEDAPRPEAGAGEVLVRISATGVNPMDWKLRTGMFKEMIPLQLPYIPGSEFSGIVEKLGAGVTGFAVGDAVFGKIDFPRNGSYAQYAAVPSAAMVRKPRKIDHAQAAAVPVAALTAWQALFGAGSLELAEGQTLLVLGAAGGVGSFAVQFAKWKGARVVAAGRAEQQAHLHSLGADLFVDTAKGLSSAGKVDAVLDLVAGDLQDRAWPQLKRGGAFASTLSSPSADEAAAIGARTVMVYLQTSAHQLEQIGALLEQGKVKTSVTKVLPLERAREAQELLESSNATGKLVLEVS